tara:strand:+ start:261 stop:497 length:237 start_codon:yes stop_codon:yes gene_type:complete
LLSCNPNITWEIVQSNPDKPWNYCSLNENTMLKAREEFIEEEIKKFTEKVALNKIAKILFHPERYLGKKYIREWEYIN